MAHTTSLSKFSVVSGLTAGRQALINIAIAAAVLIIFGSQLNSLRESIAVLGKADVLLVVVAAVLVVVSFIVAALTYFTLAAGRVRLLPTFCIQVASGFVNRLLPVGIGSLGLYIAYLHRQGMSVTAATALVFTNNILGTLGTLCMAAAVLLVRPEYLRTFTSPRLSSAVLIAFAIGAVLVVAGLIFGRTGWENRARLALSSVIYALRANLRPSRITAAALAYNIVLTVLFTAILSLSISAVGGSISLTAALLVLSFGMMVGSAVPTPGGIGGVEAGLLAGILVSGVTPASALAAVMLFRALTYWLPILPGAIMFYHIRRRML